MPDTDQAVEEKQVQSIELSEASESGSAKSVGSIEMLLDMTMPIVVSIGQTEIPVRRLLQLGPGAVLQMDKPIDEPVDLYLRDIKFATGDVVVVDGRFAVKIKDILSAPDSEPNQPPQSASNEKQ